MPDLVDNRLVDLVDTRLADLVDTRLADLVDTHLADLVDIDSLKRNISNEAYFKRIKDELF